MSDEPTCVTGCGMPCVPRSNLCQSHSAEWSDSKERDRAESIVDEYPPLQDRSKEQASELNWRLSVALMDFVKRIAVEVSAVKLGKVVPVPAKTK